MPCLCAPTIPAACHSSVNVLPLQVAIGIGLERLRNEMDACEREGQWLNVATFAYATIFVRNSVIRASAVGREALTRAVEAFRKLRTDEHVLSVADRFLELKVLLSHAYHNTQWGTAEHSVRARMRLLLPSFTYHTLHERAVYAFGLVPFCRACRAFEHDTPPSYLPQILPNVPGPL